MEIPVITKYTLAILWLFIGLARDIFEYEFSKWPTIIWEKISRCMKCQVFWLTLITSFNLPLAALLSVGAAIVDKYIHS